MHGAWLGSSIGAGRSSAGGAPSGPGERARAFDNDRDRKDRLEAEQVRLEGIRRRVREEVEHDRRRRAEWQEEYQERRARMSAQARQRALSIPRRNGRWVKVEKQVSADEDELQGWPAIST